MSIVPILTSKQVIKKLTRAGFCCIYVKGSHYFLENTITKHTTSIPMHCGKDIGRGLLIKILKQAGISIDEFNKL